MSSFSYSNEVYCIDDDGETQGAVAKTNRKRKGTSLDEPIDLTEDSPTEPLFNDDDDPIENQDDGDEIQVIVPLHTLLNRFRNSMTALVTPSAVGGIQLASASKPKRKPTPAKKTGYGFGYGGTTGTSSSTWSAGVGYGGSAQADLLSATKSVQLAQKKVSLEDSQAAQAFRGVHFCLTANEGVISAPLLSEIATHRMELLRQLDRRLKNDSLMDIASRKELYLAVLDTLDGVLSNKELVGIFLNLSSTVDVGKASASSSSSSAPSLLQRLIGAVSHVTGASSVPAAGEEPEEPSLRTCHHWLRHLSQQAGAFLQLQRSAGNTVDEEFIDTLEIAAHVRSTFDSLDEILRAAEGDAKPAAENLDDGERKPAASSASSSSATGCKAGADLEKEYVARMTPLRFEAIPLLAVGAGRGAQAQVPYQFRAHVAAEQRAGDRARVSRILNEISTLASSLPVEFGSSVFVRCDEDRYDVLKALIIGPVGTPYENGCFEFDIFLPHAYPSVPPLVHLRTTGNGTVRFNPNLYNCGKVCLSLLGTWSGPSWDPKSSTLLQVLVSIQALILVPDPFFNEPGYEASMGSAAGKKQSEAYNTNIRKMTMQHAVLTQLRTCLSTSPADSLCVFRDVIRAHFMAKKQAVFAQLKEWGMKTDAVGIQVESLLQSL